MLPRPPSFPLFPYTTLFRSNFSQRRLYLGILFLLSTFNVHLSLSKGGSPRLAPWELHAFLQHEVPTAQAEARDRKSTRLNSSHANISYAVFCLKKKKKKKQN